ncbi:MAG: phosphoglycerate mutase, partial [Turicibacter sp.]
DLLPKSKTLQQLMKNSAIIFNKHDLQGCILWPWGLSKKVALESFEHKHKKRAGIISGIDLINGMGIALHMKSIIPSECTGYGNTNLTHKLNAALELIKEVDVLIVHINGLDELAHQKDWVGKLEFLERIKQEFLIPFIEQAGPCHINITCDHVTDSKTGKHEMGKVPLLMFKNKKDDIK